MHIQSKNIVWEDSNKFDLKFFKKNSDKNSFYTYITSDTKGAPIKITLIEDVNFYSEFIQFIGTPFTIEKKYFKENLSLENKTYKFYSIKYDYSYSYDRSGNLINKKDENNTKISIYSLHDLMQNKYNIDIYQYSDNSDDNYLVQKSMDPAVYYIKKPLNMTLGQKILKDGMRQDLYEVDAMTGEIISSPTQASTRKNKMIDVIKKEDTKKENIDNE